MITLTDKAVTRVNDLMTAEARRGKGLRIYVEGGGCSGLLYGFTFDECREGDEVLPHEGFDLYVDPMSARHLAGATVDFVDDLSGSGFRVTNPNARNSCGCGRSFC